jgi:hypothetical protein
MKSHNGDFNPEYTNNTINQQIRQSNTSYKTLANPMLNAWDMMRSLFACVVGFVISLSPLLKTNASASSRDAKAPFELELYPTYHCVGVEIRVKDAGAKVNQIGFEYRVNDESEWREGHVMTPSPDGKKLWASAFRFQPGDKVDVRARLQEGKNSSSVVETTTRLKTLPEAPKNGVVYFISPKGDDSNEGTRVSPFASFEKALAVLKPGDTLRVMAGLYTKPLALKNIRGTPGKPIIIEGEDAADACKLSSSPSIPSPKPVFPVITSAQQIDGSSANWKSHGKNVFSIKVPNLYRGKRQESYVAMDGLVMFNYANPETFEKNECETERPLMLKAKKGRVPVVEQGAFDEVIGKDRDARPACTYDEKSGTLTIRLYPGDEPSRHRFTYATEASGVLFESCSHVIVRNLEITGFGRAGVSIAGGNRECSLINNLIHHNPTGIFCADRQTETLTIWNNHIYDLGLHQYSWRTLMSKRKAGGQQGILIHAGRGHSIVGNRVHGHFDLFCVNAPDFKDWGFNRDTDIIDNYGYNSGDDHIEADDGAVNMRILGNKNVNTLECWSLAPIFRGPVYVVGNFGLARNYSIKFNNNTPSTGACFVYHNTGYTVGNGTRAINMPLGKEPFPFSGKVLRNNLFISGKTFVTHGRLGSSLDYNGYWIITGDPEKFAHFDWEGGGKYKTVEEFYKGVGNEQHGLIADPKCARLLPELTSAELLRARAENRELDFDLRLTAQSPYIDRGTFIPGIHHGKSDAPDMGAFEFKSNSSIVSSSRSPAARD